MCGPLPRTALSPDSRALRFGYRVALLCALRGRTNGKGQKPGANPVSVFCGAQPPVVWTACGVRGAVHPRHRRGSVAARGRGGEGLNPLTLLPWRDSWLPAETAYDKRVFNAAMAAEVALMAATRFGAGPPSGSRPPPPAAPPPPRPLRPPIARGCKRKVDAVCYAAVLVVGRLRQGPRAGRGDGADKGSEAWWARQKWRALRGGVRSQTWSDGRSWSIECRKTDLDGAGAPQIDAELVVVRPSKLRRRRTLAEESDEDGVGEEDSDA